MADNKVVLVTGTSSGFGLLTVKTLAKDGHKVYATMRGVDGKNKEAAEKLRQWSKEEKVDVIVTEIDVTDEKSVDNAVKDIVASAGRIDVVVNNAGIIAVGPLETFTIDDTKKIFDVNVLGPLRVNRAVLPSMRKQKSGLLIQISSTAGRIGVPFTGIYTSSKFAVEALAEAFNDELVSYNIESVIIEPGAFPTEIMGKVGQPSDTNRVNEYGELAKAPEQMMKGMGEVFSGPNAPNPQEIADAIKKLVDTPTGKRPIRTSVGSMGTGGVTEYNKAYEKAKAEMMKSMGM